MECWEVNENLRMFEMSGNDEHFFLSVKLKLINARKIVAIGELERGDIRSFYN